MKTLTQSTPETASILSESESAFLSHMMRWGSDGYPVAERGSKWFWDEFFGVRGAPGSYKTKREAMAAIETYIDILCAKSAGRPI